MGNHSALLLVAPGQLPASPNARVKRIAASVAKLRVTACSMMETDQTTMASTKPSRVPIMSKILPNSAWPMA